jgi:hypothetical protein
MLATGARSALLQTTVAVALVAFMSLGAAARADAQSASPASASAIAAGDSLTRGPVQSAALLHARPHRGAPTQSSRSERPLIAGTERTDKTIVHNDWWAPLASAVMPGTGQARLGQDRFVAYMAVEGFLWVRYLTDRRAGTDARNAYRDIAMRVSRAGFPGPKPQGNFEYYERMEHWVASGRYDSDPGAGFSPETDTTTFNGKMWSIARTTYWSDPKTPPPIGSAAYVAALNFYQQNAVTDDFSWSWRNAPLHQDVYRRSVRASNDGFRHAAEDIGAVIANHVLSTVDAYISLRLRLGDATDSGQSNLAIGATLPFGTISRIASATSRAARTR